MIVEDRSDWWTAIADHPEVKPHISLGARLDVMEVVRHASVVPFRAPHGGFLFACLDGHGRVYELHTLFTPEGCSTSSTAASTRASRRMRGF